MDNIQRTIGSAFIKNFGKLCKEAVDGGYDLDSLYNAGRNWGNFDKVILAVASLRGVSSYDQYLALFEELKPEDHVPVTKAMFARFTGIKTPKPWDQVAYNKTYRHKTRSELEQLRALNALAWIDNNVEEAKEYIAKITSVDT